MMEEGAAQPSCPSEEGPPPSEEGDPNPCPEDEEFFSAPDAQGMEGAINKFMEGLEGQERSGFSQLNRLLSVLPVPVQQKTRSMTHAQAFPMLLR